MALANVGCLLATKDVGQVLLIDWDLEAPGLHRYFHGLLTQVETDGSVDDHPGLVDFLIEVRHHVPHRTDAVQSLDEAAALLADLPLDDYVIETDVPGVRLLKAGRCDDGYPTRVNTFDWPLLYRESPWLMQALVEMLVQKHAFVLVDSRTGYTDTSGICTMQLPERLVVVFTPGRQSLTGVSDLVRQATRYRRESDDLRPLVVYPLPSRIDASETELARVWRYGDPTGEITGYQPLFESVLAEAYDLPACSLEAYFNDVQVQHVPRYAYGEDLAVFIESQDERLSIARSYANFVERLTATQAPWEQKTADPFRTPFINRQDEQQLFLRMLDGKTPARVLMINAARGTGKTALLRRFVELCRFGQGRAIPVSMLSLAEVERGDSTAAVTRISTELASAGVEFPRLNELSRAYAVRDVGTILGQPAKPGPLGTHWTAASENVARNALVDAFYQDVLDQASIRPIAILVDDVDAASSRLAASLETLAQLAMSARGGAGGLIVVFAGSTRPAWIERMHSARMLEVNGLSEWTAADIRDFMAALGVPYDARLVDLLVDRLQREWSPEMLLTAISMFNELESGLNS